MVVKGLGVWLAVAVVLLGVAPAASLLTAQVTNLTALHQAGQTFLTWTESAGAGVSYRVYRSSQPILAIDVSAEFLGEVDELSSENLRQTGLSGGPSFFRITELGTPLEATDGLFVHTVSADGDGFYAVTSVVGGFEDTTVSSGQNSLTSPVAETAATPRPILQSIVGFRRHYVHWVSDQDTAFAPAMWNRPSRAFNLRVIHNPSFVGPRPVLLKLHARGGNYQLPPDFLHPEAVVLSPDDWIGESPGNTFWYGLNEAFPDTSAYARNVNVDYTVRRVMAELDFVQNESLFDADPDRVYLSGSSMGGVGAVFLAYRYPDRFAAAHAIVPKFDFSCSADQCWLEPENGDLLWGTLAGNLPTTDGIGVYDRLNLGFLAEAEPGADRPLITAWNGRNDVVVGWPEKPPTYQAILSARQPAVFLWDESEHGGIGGVWGAVMNQRRAEMWSYRIAQALPAFSSLSIDDDPGEGDPIDGDLVGSINGYLEWDVASIEDTVQHHAIRCALRSTTALDDAPAATATVDWTPRRLQQFFLVPGASYLFSNFQEPSGNEIESRSVVADANGIVTVPAAIVTQQGNVFRLETLVTTPEFRRGDSNQDAETNIGDAIYTLSHLFSSGPPSICAAAADANDDNQVDIGDAIFTLAYLFSSGSPPPAPGPDLCGVDPSSGIDCGSYPCP